MVKQSDTGGDLAVFELTYRENYRYQTCKILLIYRGESKNHHGDFHVIFVFFGEGENVDNFWFDIIIFGHNPRTTYGNSNQIFGYLDSLTDFI